MSHTFGTKKQIMDSSEHTTIKKANAVFCGISRFSVPSQTVSSRMVSFTSEPGNTSRTIVDVIPRSRPGGIGQQKQLLFDPDPTNPNRFIQQV